MIDSWGSIPAGILKGHLKDLGHYDECVAIEQSVLSSYTLTGKYCLAQLPLEQLLGNAGGIMRMLSVQTAVCFPSACSASNMDTLLRRVLSQLIGLELSESVSLVSESTCKTSEQEAYDALTIFTM